MATYDLGDGVNLRHYVYDRDGNLTDATVALTIYKPDGTSGVTVQRTSLGVYDANTYVPLIIGDYRYRFSITGAITDVAVGAFTVADPGPAIYTELPLVKSQLGKITADDRDEMIEAAIVAASRMIDSECGVWPGAFRADTAVSTRVFSLADRVSTPTTSRTLPNTRGRMSLRIDPVASMTGLLIETGNANANTWASYVGTYTPGPDNALAYGRPIEYLTLPQATFWTVDSMRVTARWGWPTVPAEIQMATRLLAARLYRRKDSPQGVITSSDWGAVRVSRTDPDVHALLFPFMIPGFA